MSLFKIFIVLSALVFTYQTNAQTLPSCNSYSVARVRNGTVTYSSNLHTTIVQSNPGDVIYVGAGVFPSVSITARDNITVKSLCNAQVPSFNIKNSDNIRIEGFSITGSGSNSAAAVVIDKGKDAVSYITLVGNKISAGGSASGVLIKNSNSTINLENNDIYGNGNGIEIDRGNANVAVNLTGNNIRNNLFNGIQILGSPVVNITGTNIENNGLANNSANGYGIKATASTSSRITVKDSSIVNNRGQVVAGQSSQDLSIISSILDATDSNNITTNGNEGPGVRAPDITPPQITSNITEGAKFNFSPITLTVNVAETNFKETLVYLDNLFLVKYTQKDFTHALSLNDGNHSLRIESFDLSGNQGTLVLQNISVDTVNPAVSLNIANNSKFTTTSVPLNVSVVESNLQNVKVYVNDEFAGQSLQNQHTFNLNLREGANFVRVIASDTHGNSTTYDITNIQVDSTGPAITTNLASGAMINTPTFLLNINVTEVNFLKTKVYLNGSLVTENTNASFEKSLSLSQGANLVRITSEDTFGNLTTLDLENILVDSVAPLITANTNGNIILTNPEFSFSAQVAELNLQSFRVLLNNQTLYDGIGSSFSGTISLAQGTNTLRVIATDTFNNTSTLEIPGIFVDSIGPVLTLNRFDGETVEFDNSKLVDFKIYASELVQNVTINGISAFGFIQDYIYTHQVYGQASEQFLVRAEDLYGNVTEKVINLNYVLDTVRPVISVTQSGNIFTKNSQFLLNVSVNDLGDTKTRIVINGSEHLETEEKTISTQVPLVLGENTIEVTSIDEAGNIAIPVVLEKINFNNQPLVLSISSPQEGQELEDSIANISGTANKQLGSITANGKGLDISPDKSNFNGNFDFSSQTGELTLNFNATDLWGNTATFAHKVFTKDNVRKNLSYITDSKLGKIYVYDSDTFSLVREINIAPYGVDQSQTPLTNNGNFANIELSVDKKKAYIIQAEAGAAVSIDLTTDHTIVGNDMA